MEQKINTRKTDEGYFVEVLNDDKVVWTDTFDTEEELNLFIKGSDGKFTQKEARKLLESGEYGIDIFYRHPLGYRFAAIFNLDALPEYNEHGIEVHFVNKDNGMVSRIVPTIDEAFKLIKAVENGEI